MATRAARVRGLLENVLVTGSFPSGIGLISNSVRVPVVVQRSLHPVYWFLANGRILPPSVRHFRSQDWQRFVTTEESLGLYLTAAPNQILPVGPNCKICSRGQFLKSFVQTFFSFFSEESPFFLPFFLLTRNHSSMLSRMNSPRSSNSCAEFFQNSLKASAL